MLPLTPLALITALGAALATGSTGLHSAGSQSLPDEPSATSLAKDGDEAPAPAPGALALTPEARARYREYFAIADYDGNGWISFREARESLGVDRLTYAAYDTDRDGRVVAAEFERRMMDLEARAGFMQPPSRSRGPQLLPIRNSEQLRNAFDTNADGALEEFEIDHLLATYNRSDIPTRIVLEKLDANNDQKLQLNELTALSQLLSTTYSEQDDLSASSPQRTLDELFGGLTDLPSADYQRTLHPPRIGGPVLPFRRLDLDANGLVTATELERLQRPLTLSVRLAAVLAALDIDGDGALSSSEFAAALQ